jgi:hypothetical protein
MRRTITFVLIGILFTAYARANPLSPQQVPEPLTPWVNWVLQDEKELSCPFAYNSYGQKRCSWPTQLDLDFTATKGSFAINWSVYQESWVVLPGDPKHWPQNVTINSKTAVVLERNGLPAIKLPAGTYQIKGDFFWIAIPENISIPADTGLVGLRVNGVSISMLNIRGGQLWLTENDIGRKKPENVQNSLDIQVFRKIIDEVPMQVTTRLVLEVSGEQREIKLPKPLLDTLVPLSLQSPLPARIEPDGQLLMQVRPGRWQMDIEARSAKETNVLALNTNDPSWPRSEIWVFDARPDLRVVEVEKLQPIDASQTNTPEEWRHLPTYSINQGGNMSLKLIRKGDPEPEPNQLTINRKLWLDFAGEGYTINDTINGKMTKGWRLDALPETQLGKVNLDGVSQLITLQPGSGKQGIEVRKGAISLDADSRIVGNIRSISAVGWEQNFNQVNAELNLPPGWRLLAASGVDNVPDSWVSRWTLLDLFLVLIAALATSRLFNRVWGFFALLTLVLIWHEPGSPHFIWLCILAATALIKVLPQGKFFMLINWVRNAFWLGLIFIVVPFMVNQIRTGLYPQLEYPWQGFMMPNSPVSTINEVATPAMAPEMDMVAPAPMQEQPAKSIMPEKKRGYKSGSSSQSEYDRGVVNFNRYDPDAKVQTGPGLPQWQWHKVNLSWNGSVAPGQQVKLWYLSPTLTMLLGFLRVALVSVLTLLTFGLVDKLKFKAKTVTPALLWFLLIPMWAAPTQNTYADFPSKEVLDELRTRLLEAPDCMPICAQIPQMQVDASDKDLLVTLHVHTQGSVNLPLPVSYDQWFPSQVTVDGKAAQGLYRDGNGLWLNLLQGEHQVTLRGTTPLLTTFTLPLPLKPNRVVINPAKNSGWQVSGVQDNGEVENQLQFNRTNQTVGNTKSTIAPGLLPPFVRLERTLQLGLDWRLVTQIVRLSPADSAIVLEVPLLAGEQVTTSGIHVKDGKVAVNMATQQTTLQWEAKLEKGEKINFNAADTNYWTEVWKIDVNPIWHIETSGITPIHVNTEGQWLPEWHPWPGETLALQITRPKTVAGQTLTIDSSQLAIRPGKRSLDADLKMSIRSSQGTQHTFTLPEGAVLQTVIIAGQTLPLRQEGRKLTLPINPGKQDVALTWQEHAEISSITKTPQIDLGQASVNTRLNIGLGQDRWVLFVWGPKLSPAVLFWGVLVVIVILAIGLGKVSLTPLKSWHWLLLLIGLSQAPMESAALVVAWLMLLGWRASRPDNNFKYFNLVQIIMGLFTIFSLGILLFAVEQGLLGGSPDMQITGNQSSAFNLNWYQDRSASTLPQATVVSIPLMAYRLLMLAWSFWLAGALLNWLKWGWQCFSKHGLWNKKPERVKTPVTVDKVVEKK